MSKYKDFEYEIYIDEFGRRSVGIIDYEGKDSALQVPPYIDGFPVEHIAAYAFAIHDALTDIQLPDTIISVADYAFYQCSSLKHIKLGSNLSLIMTRAFSCCTSLEEINIPQKVSDIEYNAFLGCTNLKKITVETGNTSFYSRDGVLFTNSHVLLTYPSAKRNCHYTPPANTKQIFSNAFNNCCFLETVSLPNSISKIENFAFTDCDALKNITIPITTTHIENNAVSNCQNVSFTCAQNSFAEGYANKNHIHINPPQSQVKLLLNSTAVPSIDEPR